MDRAQHRGPHAPDRRSHRAFLPDARSRDDVSTGTGSIRSLSLRHGEARQLDSTLVVRTAALVADPARAAILQSLSDGRPRPAGELARRAGGLVLHCERSLGSPARWRAPRRRSARVGTATTGWATRSRWSASSRQLAALAPAPPASGRSPGLWRRAPFRRGRTCYNHLAGILGVSIMDALLRHEWLALEGRTFELTVAGEAGLVELGVDVATARRPGDTGARSIETRGQRWPGFGAPLQRLLPAPPGRPLRRPSARRSAPRARATRGVAGRP